MTKYLRIIFLIPFILLYCLLAQAFLIAPVQSGNIKRTTFDCLDQHMKPNETIKIIGKAHVRSEYFDPIYIRALGTYTGFIPLREFEGVDNITYELKVYNTENIHICYYNKEK